jgi:dolichol-phosphate mannosyltransferase
MPELSIIVPTFNERLNVLPVTAAIERTLNGLDYEIIFVDDDSPDGTASLARQLAQGNKHVRVIQRVDRTGLASAVVEGFLASSAPYTAVIDGDMQHDERVIPACCGKLKPAN